MDIINEIKQIKSDYERGTIEIIDGLDFSQYDLLKQIEFYTNSRYLDSDSETFYNIVNYRVNVGIRATDLDTKDIQIFTENPLYLVRSMIFSKAVKNWMRETYFSKTLNDITETRVRYGGALVKRYYEDGELYLSVPQWKNLITDPVDIEDGVIAEKHYLTPIELNEKRNGVWNMLDEEWDEVEKIFEKQYKDNLTNSSRICVLEVEGIFPDYYLEDTSSEDFSLQKHFIICDEEGEPKLHVHAEAQKESDYKYIPYDNVSGRALGRGIVEDGLQAQIATNKAILAEEDIMNIASRTTFYTDSDILQNNMLSDTQTGDIMKIGKGDSIGILNTLPASLPQLENIIEKWKSQYDSSASTFEAITGETMPSGTPFRSVAIQNQEAQSLFNYRREEYGIFLNELFTDWIIPHIKKQIKKSDFLSSEFEDDELEIIDEELSKDRVKTIVKDRLLEGKVTTMDEYMAMKELEKFKINKEFKRRRFLEIPKDYFKDVELKLDILTTGEQINKSAVFETLSNILQTVASNPQILQVPELRKIFSKIVELSGVGISPEQLMQTQPTQTAQPQQTEAPQLATGLDPEAQEVQE